MSSPQTNLKNAATTLPKGLPCEFIGLPQDEAKPLTVGDRFQLSCMGKVDKPLSPKAQFTFSDEKDQYQLHILNVQESTENGFKLVVTSYRAGEFKDVQLTISDNGELLHTQPLSWKVTSVLPPPPEKAEPFPSQGPFHLSYPLWLWLSLVGAIVLTLGAMIATYYFHNKKKKLREKLLSYATVLTPLNQFSKDLRFLLRKIATSSKDAQMGENLKQLNEIFRLYLVRELIVPALENSDRAILSAIKKENSKIYDNCHVEIRRILSEFDKANRNIEKLQARDVEELSVYCRKTAEKISLLKKKGAK